MLRLVAALLLAASFAASAAELKPWPGGPTPALELDDMAGQTHRLADYRGKVVLVNFWATWCEPCRAEMPSMDGLRRSLQGKPFEVLAVNLAEPLSRIENFLGAVPLGFPLLRDRDGAVAKLWKARLLPASFLVGRDGRIRYVAYGELDWTSQPVRARVEELLSEQGPGQRRAGRDAPPPAQKARGARAVHSSGGDRRTGPG
ncbi:MAG TPA: TlpA disulfide reductase family protein [Burkholderiales bacterium]|nr:TlpA disulfide reductase family protein [Burkholderiales bacterium]